MPTDDIKQRIKFAYFLDGWSYENNDQSVLKKNAEKVLHSEYIPAMEGSIFCPTCFTNLIRVPKRRDHFSNGRDAYFAHIKKYQAVKCSLRVKRAEGKRYENYEEAQKAIDDENLVIVTGFLERRPERPEHEAGEYDETPVEDQNGQLTEVPLGRHNGESFNLPSKITTVAGICRNFDVNLYKYYYFPNQKIAIQLIDLLHSIEQVTEEGELPRLYYGLIKSVYDPAKNPKPHNIRMTELVCNKSVKDFNLKTTLEVALQKGITQDAVGRIVIMYGTVTTSGIGLSIENLNWGEFALLPRQYSNLLIM